MMEIRPSPCSMRNKVDQTQQSKSGSVTWSCMAFSASIFVIVAFMDSDRPMATEIEAQTAKSILALPSLPRAQGRDKRNGRNACIKQDHESENSCGQRRRYKERFVVVAQKFFLEEIGWLECSSEGNRGSMAHPLVALFRRLHVSPVMNEECEVARFSVLG